MSQTYQGNVDQEKPFQGLKTLSSICSILGYLSFLGGFVLASNAASEAVNSYDDPVLSFFLWLGAGFVSGIGYLIAAEVIKLFIAAKENLEELLISTREIAAYFKEANAK